MMESCVSVRIRGKMWNDHMERIMNEDNNLDHNVEDVLG